MALSKMGQLLKKIMKHKLRFVQLENGFFEISVKNQHTDIRYWKITRILEDKEGEIFQVELHEIVSRVPGEMDKMACTTRSWYRVALVGKVQEI